MRITMVHSYSFRKGTRNGAVILFTLGNYVLHTGHCMTHALSLPTLVLGPPSEYGRVVGRLDTAALPSEAHGCSTV